MNVSEKLESVLNNFIYNKIINYNSVYFELLISNLSTDKTGLLQAPFITKWILSCLERLENDLTSLDSNIFSFAVRVCALVAENEWLIVQLRDEKVLDRFHKLFTDNHENLTHSIKLSSIRFLKSISNYSLGLGWMRLNCPWKYLINYCYKNHTIYVVQESKSLLYDLLYKFSVKLSDDKICIEILNEIMKPITDNVFPNNMSMVIVDDGVVEGKIIPALDLLSYIFERTLESEEKTSIVHLCEENFQLELNIWKLAGMSTNQTYHEKVIRTLSTHNFARLVYEKWTSGKIADVDFNLFGVTFFNIMKFCVTRKAHVNFLRMAEFNHKLWKKLGDRAPEQILIENERIEFENQLIALHLLPVLFICKHCSGRKDEEFLDNFIMKLFSISCEFTQRICYSFRDILFECPDKVPDLASKSIYEMISMDKYLDKSRAVLIFQALCYTLKEFVDPSDIESSIQSRMDITHNVLHAVLIGMKTLIENYDISWKDCLETICLTNFTQSIIDNPNVNSRLAVQAIKLSQVSIEHFLAPNMALLMDSLHGSGLQQLGPIITKRFYDVEWEVRDSSIELINSIAEISDKKYPAFQNYLVQQNIPLVINTIANNDSEAYVRASAYKCISQLCTIDLIWEKALRDLNIDDQLMMKVYIEDEGIVRKEIVNVLSVLYDNNRIIGNYESLFSTMCHCVAKDLYWEVKTNALKFWKAVIYKEFSNQGMIDGKFPPVTFSKEKKKIVTLTEKEIILRIERALEKLSNCGCLGILMYSLRDECDIEVVKISVDLTKKLFVFFDQYDYFRNYSNLSDSQQNNQEFNQTDHNTNNLISSEINIMSLEEMEKVINSITSTDDLTLLGHTYDPKEAISDSTYNLKYFKNFAEITPAKFISYVKNTNIEKMMSMKNKWIMENESFNSLLDDILLELNGFHSSSDCY